MSIPDTIRYDLPPLPRSTAGWRLDPRRAVLLVHDMQGYFLRPFAADVEPGRSLRHHAAGLRARCAQAGIPVAYTAQPGSMTPAERGLLADFWGPGMTTEPEHRSVDPRLAPGPDDWMFTKWRYSAFHRTDLLARMRAAGRDQLVLCGVYAHVGVLMTACDAFTHDIQPFLVADAVADFSAQEHRMALTYAAGRCAVVTSTAAVLAALATPVAVP